MTPLPPDPQEEDLQHFELEEGFQWASVECDAVTLPCSGEDWERQDLRTSSTNHTLWSEKTTDGGENPSTSETSRLSQLENADLHDDNTSETQALARRQNSTPLDSVVCVKTEKLDDYSIVTTLEKSDHDRIVPIPNGQIKQEIQVRILRCVNK